MPRPRPGRRRIDPERENALRSRQANLTALGRHPAWPDMEAVVAEKVAKYQRLALAHALGGAPDKPVDPAYLQWLKGFIAGASWFAAVPIQAEGSLRDHLAKQGISMEGVEG